MSAATCRIAVVGAGAMAREHIRAFRDIAGVEIAGIHSRTRARAEALALEFGIPTIADSIPELYDATQAALVVVAVPELSATPVLQACFERPWTVLAEKPAGFNLRDADAIARSAAERKRRAYLAVNRRFLSSTRATLADLETIEGERYIHVQDQQDQATALKAGQPAEVVKNWMYANSIHVVDLFRVFGRGNVADVEVVRRYDPAKPGTVLAYLRFSSGDCGVYQGIWNGPGPWAVTINTPARRYEIRPLEQLSTQNRGERVLTRIDPHPWDTSFKPGFRLQAQAAVDAALGRPTILPTLEEGLESMRLIQRIFGVDH